MTGDLNWPNQIKRKLGLSFNVWSSRSLFFFWWVSGLEAAILPHWGKTDWEQSQHTEKAKAERIKSTEEALIKPWLNSGLHLDFSFIRVNTFPCHLSQFYSCLLLLVNCSIMINTITKTELSYSHYLLNLPFFSLPHFSSSQANLLSGSAKVLWLILDSFPSLTPHIPSVNNSFQLYFQNT